MFENFTEMMDQFRPYIEEQFRTNDFLSGGIIVVAFTAMLGYLRSVPMQIINQIRYLSTSYLTINNDTRHLYNVTLAWLSTQKHIVKRNRTMNPTINGHDFGFGSSWFFIGWRLVRVYRTRNEDAQTGCLDTRESISFKMWGRKKAVLQDTIDKAIQLGKASRGEKTTIPLYIATGGGWRYKGQVPKRPVKSVVLPNGVLERITNRIQTFIDNEDKYHELGIPHRLGFLFEGPPGTGKTSSIVALASKYDATVRFVNLSGMTDNALIELCMELSTEADMQFLVLEDIDEAFDGDRQQDEDIDSAGKLTLSGLLNAIDGIVSGQRVLFMTTNHKERLDHALIRPGRVDLVEHLGAMDFDQANRMCQKFCNDEEEAATIALDFVDKTPCEAQEYLINRFVNKKVGGLVEVY